jgi:hypothetical protein
MLYGEARVFFADHVAQDRKGPEELRRDAAEWHGRRAPLTAKRCEERARRLEDALLAMVFDSGPQHPLTLEGLENLARAYDEHSLERRLERWLVVFPGRGFTVVANPGVSRETLEACGVRR